MTVISQSFTLGAFCLFCSPHGNDKVISTVAMSSSHHVYEVCSREDKRGVGRISDVQPVGRLLYGEL
jgi:hypothetical protein